MLLIIHLPKRNEKQEIQRIFKVLHTVIGISLKIQHQSTSPGFKTLPLCVQTDTVGLCHLDLNTFTKPFHIDDCCWSDGYIPIGLYSSWISVCRFRSAEYFHLRIVEAQHVDHVWIAENPIFLQEMIRIQTHSRPDAHATALSKNYIADIFDLFVYWF